MSIDLAADRAMAEAEFLVDRCNILRLGDGRTFDPETISYSGGTHAFVHHDLPCSVGATQAGLVDRGEAPAVAYTYKVRIAADITDVELGDVVEMSGVHDGGNTRLVGLRLVVVELPERSTTVLRRLHCRTETPTGVAR